VDSNNEQARNNTISVACTYRILRDFAHIKSYEELPPQLADVQTGPELAELTTIVADLLADVRHLCDAAGISFIEADEQAAGWYDEEAGFGIANDADEDEEADSEDEIDRCDHQPDRLVTTGFGPMVKCQDCGKYIDPSEAAYERYMAASDERARHDEEAICAICNWPLADDPQRETLSDGRELCGDCAAFHHQRAALRQKFTAAAFAAARPMESNDGRVKGADYVS
jgi:hypothetical protein